MPHKRLYKRRTRDAYMSPEETLYGYLERHTDITHDAHGRDPGPSDESLKLLQLEFLNEITRELKISNKRTKDLNKTLERLFRKNSFNTIARRKSNEV